MGMTITEKIFARASGHRKVTPGQLVDANIDVVMCHDVTTPPAISMLVERGIDRVFDPEKIVVTPDHFQPPKDVKSAELHRRLDAWAKQHKIKYYYKLGRAGVCHALLPEQGHIRPGEVIVGGDSHTCTYGALAAFSTGIGSTDLAASIATGRLWFRVPASMKFVLNGSLRSGVYSKDVILTVIARIGTDGALYKAMEFVGPALAKMSMEARMTITNMAIEAGAKNGIIGFDDVTKAYLDGRLKGKQDYTVVASDDDADYAAVEEFDCSAIEPMVALPHLPSGGVAIGNCAGMAMDQAYIGSCTNGRIEDLRIAAGVLKGKEVKIRTLVVPATPVIWKQAADEGLFDVFYDAGCVISAPTCGACLGGFMGVLAAGEKCISTTNRNFVGRMGSPKSEVYLASPATVAASAVEGRLADPRKHL
ncbi:MAG: 3-isopropylmalate dehydratase large subunit [Sedimentisphaerales bacterium]|jgi:3-isopropylmalate/(R)-2-methylmalate dehydratase large subunit|nr:3-isopropylmalate dehydratase large subunit [Sedimentisphaerales bacterium]HNY78601.1 3-isopropylmalate dehydratase large subunit [Sedimentisphaerales bacterium]HOC64265.1 3-isopropylmalate dehydratase large subunit [Sedimentisphaerales bacterium]HOH64583.1 3-isopropylmalate dehydratase large subunit [Sedimentisphaerales bacterium]HPY50230.1 3-isopropylmalate dehydratase large subunit [Sedimentisphaerales bacterium]